MLRRLIPPRFRPFFLFPVLRTCQEVPLLLRTEDELDRRGVGEGIAALLAG